MIYRCKCCHLIFDEPDVMRRRENLDGERGYVLVTEKFCPDCGMPVQLDEKFCTACGHKL